MRHGYVVIKQQRPLTGLLINLSDGVSNEIVISACITVVLTQHRRRTQQTVAHHSVLQALPWSRVSALHQQLLQTWPPRRAMLTPALLHPPASTWKRGEAKNGLCLIIYLQPKKHRPFGLFSPDEE